MTDQIHGIDPVKLGQDVDLFFQHPYTGPIAMDQDKGISFSFDGIEERMPVHLNRSRKKGRVPVNRIRPNERDATVSENGPGEKG
jgi:hypothetical protein